MPKAPPVEVPIELNDKLTKKLAGVQAKIGRFGKKMRNVGKTMTTHLSAPIALIGGAIVMTAAKFETSMNNVSALTNATAGEFQAMRDQAKDLGKSTMFSASQTADAMGFLAQAGFKTNEIMSATPGILKLAAAGNMELAEAADLASNVLEAYGMEAKDINKINEALAHTSANSNTNIMEMGEAMKFVAPVAAGMGISVSETAAAIGLLGNAGIKASMAGTTLRQALTKLATPSGQAVAVLNKLKINKADILDSKGNVKSLTAAIQALEKSGATSADILTIFGQRAGPGMMALVSQGSAALQQMNKDIRTDGAATLARLAAVRMKGFNGAMKSMKSVLEGVAIAIADSGILDWFTKLATKLTSAFRKVAEFSPGLLKFGFVMAMVVAVIGPLIFGIGLLASAVSAIAGAIGVLKLAWIKMSFAFLASPVFWVIVGIVALIAAGVLLYKNWDVIMEKMGQLWEWIKKIGGNIGTFFVGVWESVSDSMITAFDNMIAFFGKTWDRIKNIGGKIKDFFTFGNDEADSGAGGNAPMIGVEKIEKQNADIRIRNETRGKLKVELVGKDLPENIAVKPKAEGDFDFRSDLGFQGGN